MKNNTNCNECKIPMILDDGYQLHTEMFFCENGHLDEYRREEV